MKPTDAGVRLLSERIIRWLAHNYGGALLAPGLETIYAWLLDAMNAGVKCRYCGVELKQCMCVPKGTGK